VLGEIKEDRIVLERAKHHFSKRFIGKPKSNQNGCELEGEWEISFWSRIWGIIKTMKR